MNRAVGDRPQKQRTLLFRFVLLLGAVSFFADATYEGGRSLLGPFLLVLGAGPVAVGLVAGGGEFLGYAVRYPAGLLAKSERSRTVLLYLGYLINLVALPLMAFVHELGLAIALLFLERLGRGLRNPPKKTLLAGAGDVLGSGRVFGLHEAMDQIGAVAGPLLIAATIAGGYSRAFLWLFVPAAGAVFVLVLAMRLHRRTSRVSVPTGTPSAGGVARSDDRPSQGFFWLCACAGLLIMGLSPMILFGYTLMARGDWSARLIALGFAWSMAVSALSALVFGRVYDRYGTPALKFPIVLVPLTMFALSAAHPSFADLVWGLTGWGLSIGAMEGMLHAAVARHASTPAARARLFGIFDAVYGGAWMLGGLMMGWLEATQPQAVIIFSLATSVVALYALQRHGRCRRRAP